VTQYCAGGHDNPVGVQVQSGTVGASTIIAPHRGSM
jgi:hypothetical protein